MLPRLASILLAALVATACAAESPDEAPEFVPDGGSEPAGTATLTVKDPIAETPWPSVVIEGTGPGGGELTVDSSAGGQKSYPIPASGNFCIDVTLGEGDNTIKLEAESAEGAFSKAVYHNVKRAGEIPGGAPKPVDGPGIADRTDGASYYDNADGTEIGALTLESGDWDELVDSKTDGVVVFSGSWAGNEAVAYALSEEMKVHGFEVTAPAFDGDTCGPQAFDIFAVSAAKPDLAEIGDTGWVRLAWVDTKEGTEDTPYHAESVAEGATYKLASISRGFSATHVAIVGRNDTCGLTDNDYGLTELRVLAETGDEPVETGPQAPSCASREQ